MSSTGLSGSRIQVINPFYSQKSFLIFVLEPVGSKAPAFIGELRGGWKAKSANTSVVMSCPAQGYPVPSFRYIYFLLSTLILWLFAKIRTCWKQSSFDSRRRGKLDEATWWYWYRDPMLWTRLPSPKFPVHIHILLNCVCLHWFHCSRLLEPVGSKAPSIQGEERSYMKRRGGTNIVIPCHGQGYPVPAFR